MLTVNHIHFGYTEEAVLENISFSLGAGQNIAIIGESGSGKSTLLRLIYGEYDLTEGHIFWKDQEILGPMYNLVVGYDFMKYVAQEFYLMPFTTVEENIGSFLSNFFPEEKKLRIQDLIKVVQLEHVAKRKVKTLSGGQKQRVALARALAKQPELLLLDEPFSHIDNFKKQSLRRNLFNFLKKEGIACLVATHDCNDVLGFADEILFLDKKTISLKGTPESLFKNPKNEKMASFFGEFNTIDGRIYFAHQLKIVKESHLEGIVKKSYFNGSHWLIEVDYASSLIYIEHHSKIAPNKTIHFVKT